MTTTGPRRWWFLCAALAALILAAAFRFDGAVQNWVGAHQTRAGTGFMQRVSKWGDWPAHVALGAAGAVIAYATGRRQWLVIFAAMIIACATAGSVNRVIQTAAGRSRPSVKIETGWNGPSLKQNYHSFPSGHTVSSVAFFATLCFLRPKIGVPLLPIPFLIGSSRIYLKAHYLSDVVFAAMLGTLCAALVWRLFRRVASAA